MRKSKKTDLSGEHSQVHGAVGNNGKQQWVQWRQIKDVWKARFARHEAGLEVEAANTITQDPSEVL